MYSLAVGLLSVRKGGSSKGLRGFAAGSLGEGLACNSSNLRRSPHRVLFCHSFHLLSVKSRRGKIGRMEVALVEDT